MRRVAFASFAASAFLVAACATSSAANAIDPGKTAPDFSATDTDGRAIQLSELVKDHTVVVAFFPKAFTPG